MNPAQTNLYFREWGKVRDHYKAKGIDSKLCDAKRHELHEKALGQKKSSKAFTNADLDKVLAVFYAITRPADLAAQLKQLEQATERTRKLQDQIKEIVRQTPKASKAEDIDFYVKNYLNVVANRHCGCAFAMADEAGLYRLLGILRNRLSGNPF